MKVLVTGANGFLGRHVVAALLRRGHQVRALVRPAARLESLGWPASVEIVRADLRAARDLDQAFDGIDVLVHLAAAVTGGEDAQFAASVVGTERLLTAMAKTKTRRLVLASSFSVYDWSAIQGTLDEDSPLESAGPDLYERDGYAIAKAWQERVTRKFAREHGWDLTVLRPGWIWGRDHGYLAGLGQQVGSSHLVFGPRTRLPLTHVENCADLFAVAAEDSRAVGQTFNAVDTDRIRIWEYLGNHLRGVGERGLRIPVPYMLMWLVVCAVQAISKWIFRGKGKLPGLFVPCRFEARFKPLRYSTRKVREVLGWRPPLDYAQCLSRTYSLPDPRSRRVAPQPRRTGPLQIPSLDGIRAISFMLVFLAHAGLGDRIPGGLGVTIFFFLSGYLITTLMREEHAATGDVSFRQFYMRRALRILPPFYTVLFAGALAANAGIIATQFDPRVLAAQALHFANYWTVVHGWDGEIPGTGVYWSLAVEEHFYLLFPLVFVLLHRRRATPLRRAAVLWAVCAAILAWRCWLVYGTGSPSDRTFLASDTRFDSILLGCALALVGNPALDAEKPGDRRLWLGVLLPAGALLMFASLLIREPRFRETFRYSMQGLALYPLFITAVRYPEWGPYRLLNSRLLRWVGVLSYSLYLQHHVVIFALQRHMSAGPWLRGVAALAVSLAIATAMWHLIEQPCARLRKRLSGAARHRAPIPAAAPIVADVQVPPA